MNSIMNITCVILAFFQIIYAQQAEVNITSVPADCWVRIDSVLIGKTPLNRVRLDPGRHIVNVYPPQQGVWNYQERSYALEIGPGETQTINAVFSTPVYINSIPFGAILLADSQALGNTPLYLPFEEYRGRRLMLQKRGFKDYHFVLNSSGSVMARLEKDASYIEDEPKPKFLGMFPKRKLKSKFALLAATVASHWASFYFKNTADSNYSKYTRTADPQLRNRFWNETQKYDRFSEVSLGISYASLAGLIYLVVWK